MKKMMLVMVAAGMMVGSVQAALTTSEALNEGYSNAFAVSSTDLINSGQCIQSYSGNNTGWANGSDGAVIDGLSGAESFWTGFAFSYYENYASEAVLGTTTKNTQGYKIQQINFYQGWNSASGVDVFINKVEYQQVGSDTWTTLIENSPHYLYNPAGDVYQWSKVSLYDTAGADIATNVKSIRFTLGQYSVIREIDVIGSPVPEPVSLVLLAVGSLMLRRRK